MRTFFRDGQKDAPLHEPKPGERVNRWTIPEVICLDCGSAFGVDDSCIDRDINRMAGSGNRMMIVWLPEKCPDCNNLKVVPKKG